MALSRIWSAFIILAVLVAASRAVFAGDSLVFSRMVTGKADDGTDTVRYVAVDIPKSFASPESFAKYLGGYAYLPADPLNKPTVIIAGDPGAEAVLRLSAANPGAAVTTYRVLQFKLYKRADGIIETCKGAVNISIGLVGIMALFMGFMGIAERAGGIRLLSKIIGPFFSRLFPELPKGHPQWAI